MRRHGWIMFLLAVLVLLLLVYTVTFAVSFRQIGIVTTFGQAGEPIDGREKDERGRDQAGLRSKLPYPIQRLWRFDGRIQVFEDTHEQIETQDRQNVLITAFCAWRIKQAGKFYERVQTMARAEEYLRDLVRKEKGDAVGQRPLSDFLNTERTQIPDIEDEILRAVRKEALDRYGVEVVTLGIKSLGLPRTVTEKVIESMKIERKQFADAYRAQGGAQAALIKARAEAAREQIIAFTTRKAEAIKAKGREDAAQHYAKYGKKPEFAIFIYELEFLRRSLKENTVILGDEWLQRCLRMLRDGPSLPAPTDASSAAPGKGRASKETGDRHGTATH